MSPRRVHDGTILNPFLSPDQIFTHHSHFSPIAIPILTMDYEMISKTMITMHYILFAAVALGYDGVVAAPTGAAGSTAILPTVPLIPAQNITLTFPRDSSYHSRFAYERHLLTIVLAAIALLLVGRFSNVLPHGRRRGPASATTCTALTTYTLVDPMSSVSRPDRK